MKLSALVCAHNDEARLAECLRGLEFCDEIVVVADRCTDRTQEIARYFGARVVDGIFPLESQRKAAGLAACLGEWVLEIEPDETVGDRLAYEVRAAIHGRPRGDWFDLPMENFVGGALVRRGWAEGFGAEAAPRLYRRHVKHWQAGRVAPATTMDGRHAGALETPLVRHADLDAGQLIAHLNHQTWLRAQDLADAGAATRLGRDVLAGLRRFLACYVLRKGRREGEFGFLIALMAGLDPILSGLRARELVRARAVAPPVEAQPQPARISRTG